MKPGVVRIYAERAEGDVLLAMYSTDTVIVPLPEDMNLDVEAHRNPVRYEEDWPLIDHLIVRRVFYPSLSFREIAELEGPYWVSK